MQLTAQLLEQVIALSTQAGEAILDIYHQADGMDIQTKSDQSPVTAADLAAHHIIVPVLEAIDASIPVLSEESAIPDFDIRSQWQRYWIIDPLDGTKEFIKRNGEFTVNIALIDNHRPVLGVVHVPVLGKTYAAAQGVGAFKIEDGQKTELKTRTVTSRQQHGLPIEVVASRSHGAEQVEKLLSKIEQQLGCVSTKNMGSSLKFCLIAEGDADFYPRLALTCEWDTAAAQAIVEQAGGQVLDDQLNLLSYNSKSELLNPFFYVIGDTDYDWKELLS